MTAKMQFIERLDALTTGLPESERERLRAYFTEMIDDRIEMGMDEETAVLALGAPEDLLKDISPAIPRTYNSNSQSCSGEISEIHIHLKNADATVIRQPLPGGMSAQLRASESNRFTWSLADGVLTIAESDEVRRGLFRRDASMTLILSDCVPKKLIADSYGGDIESDGIEVMDMAVIASSSGDIRLSRFTGGGRLEITSRSGDIQVRASEIRGDCKLESMSGDVELAQLQAASLRVRTASGDTEGVGLRANTAALGAVSGDIELSDAIIETTMLCEATSGDIELNRALAPDTRLSTASGDIKLILPEVPGGVEARADSRSGDVKVPFNAAPDTRYRVQARSVSGDITIV